MPTLTLALQEEKPPALLPPPANSTRSPKTTKVSNPPAASSDAAEAPPQKKKRGRRRLLHDEEQRRTRRKVQCKLNQRRYRARQKDLISTLTLETEGVNGHLQDLRDYRDFLRGYFLQEEGDSGPLTAWNDPRPMLVARHFLRAFRAGFALHSTESSALQESFLRLVCAPEMVTQGATSGGIEALLLQLKRYTSYHGTFDLRPTSVEVVHEPREEQDEVPEEQKLTWVIEARGAVSLRISRDTLMLVYPHMLRHHDALAQRIVGQTIEAEYTATFHFDGYAKVAKLDQHIDFSGAFFRLLGSAEDVATLLEGALISPFSELGMDPQGTAAESALTRGSKQLSLRYILL